MNSSSDADRLRLNLGEVLDGFVALDREFRVVYMNRAAQRTFEPAAGDASDLTGRILWEAIPALAGSTLGERCRSAMTAAGIVEFEASFPGADRSYAFRALPSEQGLSVFVRDLDGSSDAIEQARASDELLRAVVDHAQDGILLTAPDGRILSANPAACRMLGRTEGEILTAGRGGIVDSADPRLPPLLAERARVGRAAGEIRMVRADGTMFPVQVRSTLFRHTGGELRTSLIFSDLTQQKRQESIQADLLRTVRESEELFRVTFDHAPVGLALVGLDARWLRVNERLCEILGHTAAELVGRGILEVTHPDDVADVAARMRSVLAGEVQRVGAPSRHVARGGQVVDTIVQASLVRSEDGDPRVFVLQIEDVTEKKRIEARLSLADRLASVGTLASGIAHEINNPLTYVVANLEVVAETLSRGSVPAELAESVLPAIADARLGADRVARIVGQLKTLSSAGEEPAGPVDVREMLALAIRMTENQIRHRARLVQDLGPLPVVQAVGSRLSQVFVNLLINAAQAIPEGGTEANEVRVRGYTDGAGRAVVEVFDTGGGIPGELRSRIFDPFFTTKDVGVGTGLGLSISHSIVEAVGGTIEVESTVGAGSLFRVVLPPARLAAPVSEAAAPPVAHPSAAAPRRASVLVVDDDELVARVIARTVGPKHDVVVLHRGRDAVARVGAGERFTVILCDVMMPDKTGPVVFEEIRRIDPAQADRIVFVTGGVFLPAVAQALSRLPNRVLEKPIRRPALLEVIDGYLATPAG